ncbi:hypothetical protein TSUD_253870 [Trifolium subterraneum]|uniref:Neprosin activation peptide domain-containing protein n=1 Tax=Trifolium subterraneum TaxID=3900 RepID=A0A2Z6NL76_TRISU|nr:hypothetical protein TSUD_253870 [Trifolium subterraneum]
MVKLTNTLFFVLCLVISITGQTLDVMHNPLKEDLELERQINLINKPHIKSIHTKPSFERKINETSLKSSSNLYWLENVRCPKGTVPIQRITKDDLIRDKYVFDYHNLIQKGSIVHQAYVVNAAAAENIHGIKGTTSIYNPKVDKDQSSAGHLFVQNTIIGAATNRIIIGWHVSFN